MREKLLVEKLKEHSGIIMYPNCRGLFDAIPIASDPFDYCNT
jgi:hypothetical protein